MINEIKGVMFTWIFPWNKRKNEEEKEKKKGKSTWSEREKHELRVKRESMFGRGGKKIKSEGKLRGGEGREK